MKKERTSKVSRKTEKEGEREKKKKVRKATSADTSTSSQSDDADDHKMMVMKEENESCDFNPFFRELLSCARGGHKWLSIFIVDEKLFMRRSKRGGGYCLWGKASFLYFKCRMVTLVATRMLIAHAVIIMAIIIILERKLSLEAQAWLHACIW